jgi:ribosomal protein S7
MPVAVVASIERRRPFIGASDARRGGKKEQQHALECERRRRMEEAQRRVGEAQRRRDVSPALRRH